MIDIKVVSVAHSGLNKNWIFGFCWNFIEGIQLFIPEKKHSETREAVLVVVILKNIERGTLAM